ncbi:hypothetical protein KL86PLE_70097 [uncultured Pleomorphomonas sp.]|uniref:Uncharacterized protein n=1 Tax=uncultured Pleomorphomonas sp. TaxID=442121 RepID=A0A212LL87_9HYPH|nr:hypothetical protein KL86PLE_70097 [uncultured Pleomorphomonas sp.]
MDRRPPRRAPAGDGPFLIGAQRPFGNSLRGVGWRGFREPERSELPVREHRKHRKSS